MNEPIGRIDDMRVVAKLAEAGSLTGAARLLRMPKQTVSRRLAELEEALGVQLAQRTTRKLRLTEVGRAYAVRCAEVIRLADEANAAASRDTGAPQGTLRVTADPTFGEALLPDLVGTYLQAHPAVRVEVVLTNRVVDLVEEGFEVAFRVGRLADSASLIATRLGPATMHCCATAGYLRRRGRPKTPDDLADHDCIELAPQPGPSRWPFRGRDGVELVAVSGRTRVNALPMARKMALAGLGIANLPAFACREDLRKRRLQAVLEDFTFDAGGVHVVYPQGRFLAPRVRTFVDLAVKRFRTEI